MDDFLQKTPPVPSLRVCCYGSSSSDTPAPYLQAAHQTGFLLGKRGHVCVNGAGSHGCMAALNQGASDSGNGKIVGVIHEMWLKEDKNTMRDGGAHSVFDSLENANSSSSSTRRGTENNKNSNTSSNNSNAPASNGAANNSNTNSIQMLVAGGDDLQERKKLLVQDADALVVLPGGPGTWDELWEMGCAKGIGLTDLPIVVVNVNHYYDPFLAMLQRAYEQGLTKHRPEELMVFVDTAWEAIAYLETAVHHPHHHLLYQRSTSLFHSPLDVDQKKTKWFESNNSSALLVLTGAVVGWAACHLFLHTSSSSKR